MTDNQVQAAKTRAMSDDQKQAFLKSRNWVRDRGNLWRAPNGFVAGMANAVRLQLLADSERPDSLRE